jgi:hypothetical protein
VRLLATAPSRFINQRGQILMHYFRVRTVGTYVLARSWRGPIEEQDRLGRPLAMNVADGVRQVRVLMGK